MKESLRLKVCGMRNGENILNVTSCKPDFMGFIFYRQSPRFVGRKFCVPDNFSASVKRVGVFVNQSTEEITKQLLEHKLHFIQLHGSESVEQVRALKNLGYKIIKVFSIDDLFDFALVNSYVPHTDYFLFDTKGKLHGGNAQRFNWELLKKYEGQTPFFLSGGITPVHLPEILQIQHPQLYGIDINSGVEVSPGIKDFNKIRLINNILKS